MNHINLIFTAMEYIDNFLQAIEGDAKKHEEQTPEDVDIFTPYILKMKYVLSHIDAGAYEETYNSKPATVQNLLQFVVDEFKNFDNIVEARRVPRLQERYGKFFNCLPPCVNFPYMYEDIEREAPKIGMSTLEECRAKHYRTDNYFDRFLQHCGHGFVLLCLLYGVKYTTDAQEDLAKYPELR